MESLYHQGLVLYRAQQYTQARNVWASVPQTDKDYKRSQAGVKRVNTQLSEKPANTKTNAPSQELLKGLRVYRSPAQGNSEKGLLKAVSEWEKIPQGHQDFEKAQAYISNVKKKLGL